MADNPYLQYLQGAQMGASPAGDTLAKKNPYAKFVKGPFDYSKMSLKELDTEYKRLRAGGATPDQLRSVADAYAGKEWENDTSTPYGAAKAFLGQALPSAAHTVARGVPIIGAGLDEARAKLIGAAGGDEEQALDFQRARDRRMDEQMPWLSFAGQMAGAIASGAPIAKAFGYGVGAANSTRVMPTIKEALGAAGIASVTGAADGFLRFEGNNRGPGALLGGAIAGPLGFAAPYVGALAGKGVEAISNKAGRNARLRRLGMSPDAARVALRTLTADDVGQEAADRLRRAGPNAMLADSGPAASGLLDAAIATGGPGTSAAKSAVEGRVRTAARNLRGLLNTTMGPATGVRTRAKAIYDATRGARQAAYEGSAYIEPIDYSAPSGQQLLELLRRVDPAIIRQANTFLKRDGHVSNQIKATINTDGTLSFERLPDVRFVDYVTRGANALAQAEPRGGLNARSIGKLSKDIRDLLRTANPTYDEALRQGAIPIKLTEATDTGTQILNNNFTREMLAAELKNMPQAQRTAMLGGLRDQIDEIMGNVRKSIGDETVEPRQLNEMLKLFTTDNNKQKLSMVLGQKEAGKFFRELEEMNRAALLAQRVKVGSPTNPRTVMQQAMRDNRENSLISAAVSNPSQIVPVLRQKLSGRDPRSLMEADDAVVAEISDMLTRKRGQDAVDFLPRLRSVLDARSANRLGGARSARATTRGLLGVSGTASNQPPIKRFTN